MAIPTPTKSTDPTGGVHNPMHKFRTKIIPKCVGSMPNEVTTGKKIGVKINTAGVMSIKMPTISSIKLIISRIIILLSLIPNKKALMSCGMFSNERTHDIHIEAPISSITIAVVSIDSNKTFGIPLTVNSLYIKPKTRVYKTAIAEA